MRCRRLWYPYKSWTKIGTEKIYIRRFLLPITLHECKLWSTSTPRSPGPSSYNTKCSVDMARVNVTILTYKRHLASSNTATLSAYAEMFGETSGPQTMKHPWQADVQVIYKPVEVMWCNSNLCVNVFRILQTCQINRLETKKHKQTNYLEALH